MKFTHLHVHSHYSLLDGLAKIDDLLARAKELGMESLALTDHGVMYGAVEFFMKAKDYGIKPLIGCEMYLAPNGLENKNPTTLDRVRNHLILIVKNETGYKNLMKLVSIAHLEGFYYKPRIDKKVLRKHSAGLVGMSACVEGEIASAVIEGNYEKAKALALEYKEIFDEGSFFLEIQDHPNFPKQKIANDGIIKISRETGIPVVATGDIHYAKKEDAPIQDILLCIQTNRKVDEKDRMNLMDFDLSMRSPEELAEAFKDIPEALTNTQKVVDLVDFKIHLGETILPHYQVPEGYTPETYLRHLTEVGLQKRFGDAVTEEQKKRMEYELSVIEKTGFASYFLIVQDYVNWAKDRGIVVGPGRGSAAGSFVSYLIGITNIDPIKYNLLFERFLNPERISMPDVDMDFADDRRDEVLEYVRQKYGHDRVAQIITFGTMAARAAIRDAGRALGLPYDFCDKTAKMIPQFSSIEETLNEVLEFKSLYTTDSNAKKLIDSAKRLEGVARHASMHACGVVVTKDPVTEYSPLQNIAGDKTGVVTQYSSSTKSSFVEKIGLLKMDFLGLKNLTIIQNALRILKKTQNLNIDIEKIPLDDEKTFNLLQDAHTTGVFQLESSGMKRYLKQLKPTVLEDIIAMVALYRPGPMDWIPDFIAGKHGTKKIKYLHPKLEPILKDTYGVAIYQEQVMQIARELAGFTMGEADVLRKAMGKKIIDLIREQKIKFIDSASKNGILRDVAEKVFAFIEPFAGYGFNRSHAACYAMIGYQTAYLKAHFPAEFMAALLTSDQNDTDRIAIEVSECKEMGVDVLPPNVNESFEDFAVIKGNDGTEKIRFGLNAIKNVGSTVAHEIVEERKRNGKYKSLADLVERVTSKDLNKKSIEALAKVGALEELAERNQILESLENILAYSKNIQKTKNSNQSSLFDETVHFESSPISLTETPPASKKQKLQWEKELLGLYVSDHPATEYAEYLSQVAIPLRHLDKKMVNQKIRVGGVIIKIQKINTRSGDIMFFATIEDLLGKIELLVFPKVLERTKNVWIDEKIIIAEGRLSDKDGVFKLIVDDAKEINREEVETYRRICLTQRKNGNGGAQKIPDDCARLCVKLHDRADAVSLQKLSAIFDHCQPGKTKVYVTIGETKLETPYSIGKPADTVEEIKKSIGEVRIDFA